MTDDELHAKADALVRWYFETLQRRILFGDADAPPLSQATHGDIQKQMQAIQDKIAGTAKLERHGLRAWQPPKYAEPLFGLYREGGIKWKLPRRGFWTRLRDAWHGAVTYWRWGPQ